MRPHHCDAFNIKHGMEQTSMTNAIKKRLDRKRIPFPYLKKPRKLSFPSFSSSSLRPCIIFKVFTQIPLSSGFFHCLNGFFSHHKFSMIDLFLKTFHIFLRQFFMIHAFSPLTCLQISYSDICPNSYSTTGNRN